MLKIQRASAGSGKTYALAGKYIFNLIIYKDQKGNWRLRNDRQIEDALKHILAITFTNKATSEMKQRIIKNLALLARAADLKETDNNSYKEEIIDSIPYLKEFSETTGADYSDIGETALSALKILLNNYSIFRISTIDSFFQEILRTFTYEANITDSYQLELDSSFITESAMDAAIRELDYRPSGMGNAAFWLKTLMQMEGLKSQQWNPFNKKSNPGSIYASIRDALMKLEREDFKEVKQLLDLYFSDGKNVSKLQTYYTLLKEKAEIEQGNDLKKIQKAREKVEDILSSGIYPEEHIQKTFLNQLSTIASLGINDKFKLKNLKDNQTVFKKKYFIEGNELDIAAKEMYELLEKWNEPDPFSYRKNWQVYGPLLPYLGLILEIRKFLSDILESNNLLRLSDTGYILKRIIGEDDTPFVYERLGNTIDHYLIDEFQDTSRMQWEIIYPLLNEGVSKEKDSLIIGDPKQSIYRFRNADHKLITDVVPKQFPRHIPAGFSIEDNTNWRSHTEIIKFNNYFFKVLAGVASALSVTTGKGYDFNSLYSNVVQHPHNQLGKGYVEIRLFDKNDIISSPEEGEEDPFADSMDGVALSNIGPLISSLIERGYRQKDIAVLVNTNEKGKMVVKTLVRYNETLPEGTPKIDFISDESLLVGSSPAVEIILGVFKQLSNPGERFKKKKEDEETQPSEKEDKVTSSYVNWNKINIAYNIFSSSHPQLSPREKIMKFLNEEENRNTIIDILTKTEALTLGGLVETIIKYLLDDDMRCKEAIYLASFQDLVNEYSVNHRNDPASFLEWWKSRGWKASITSPENTEAVNIMTIHKSKGLEFKCVIIPFATDSVVPSNIKTEWRWVKPAKLEDLEEPVVMPVKTNTTLQGSVHDDIYREYFDQVVTDKLNTYYVAFTRARNELYIFSKLPDRSGKGIHNYLNDILKGNYPDNPSIIGEEEALMNINDLEISEDEKVIKLGEPFTRKEIEKEYLNSKGNEVKTGFIEDYYINDNRPKIRTKASMILPSGELFDGED